MKKSIKILSNLSLVFTLLSCGGSAVTPSAASCDSKVSSYEAALKDFIADPTNKTKCQATKNSLEAALGACSVWTAPVRKTYQEELDKWTCN